MSHAFCWRVDAGFSHASAKMNIPCFSCCKFHLLVTQQSSSQHDINLPETPSSKGGSAVQWVVVYCVRWWERCFWSGFRGIIAVLWLSLLLGNWLVANSTADTCSIHITYMQETVFQQYLFCCTVTAANTDETHTKHPYVHVTTVTVNEYIW